MSRTLLLLRHAKSDWSQAGMSDHERPLNKRGRKAAPLMGQVLAEQGLIPETIVSSDALRARQTTERVIEAAGWDVEACYDGRLYLAAPETYLDVLSEIAPGISCVLMVGHNPGISNLASLLTENNCEMPTAALCQIKLSIDEFSSVNENSPGKLVGFWKPKEL